ncbi:MAG: FG-GAP-like repeat-containing protein, partial [Syntrophales bacterium]
MMRKVILITFSLIFVSASFSYANSNLFYPYVNFSTGSSPEAVAIGDVNGDGRDDVVMTTSYGSDPENDYRIFVFLQNSSGGFNPAIKYPINSSYSHNPRSIAIGDINHDGRADVVVGSCGSNIEVFIQNASGGLDPGISYLTLNSCSIKIADLNNDGLLDVVGIGVATSSVDVFLQNAGGTLNPPVSYSIVSSSYKEVDVGDVNNDGLTDIVLMSADGLIGVLTQRPDGTFNTAVYYEIVANTFSSAIAVGDVDGDNLQDVVVTYGGNQPDSKIGLFRQNTSGTLDPALSYQSYDVPRAVVIADIDNDGKKDIIVDHGVAIGVYLQGNAGTILPEELYSNLSFANYNPQNLAVGDINGDGLNDIVRADSYGLGVLYSRTGPAIPDISVSPLSINFGSVFIGSTISRDVSIYNRGTGTLTISAIDIGGPDGNAFSQTNACSTVEPGSTCPVTLTFSATTEDEKNATLTITSNDSDTPVVQVILFGYAGQPLFHPYINFPIGSQPEAVDIGDVNGDGRNDVVVTTGYYFDPENDYKIHVFLRNQFGQLDPPIKYPTNSSFSYRSTSVAIGDLNHDGRADVVVGNCGSNIEVFLQNPSGGLDPGISYPTVNSCSVRIADLNNDGLLDVVGIGAQVQIFLQNSNGTLTPSATYTVVGFGAAELAVSDINNDGLTDIIVMGGSEPCILLQKPDGTFSDPIYYDLGGEGVAVGDVNGDGLNDIVVSYSSQTFGIAVFLQNNAGTLGPATTYSCDQRPQGVAIADIVGDGTKDVIVGHYGWLGVYLQGTDGLLMPEELYPIFSESTFYNPQGLAVGDINGDGINDVVMVNYNSGLVVLYNIRTPCIAAPSITSQPQSQTIQNGQRASISVSASGMPPSFTYQWYQGSSGDISNPISGATSNFYATPPITQTTSYWVRVTNSCGSADSNTATITVTVPCIPPSITSQPQSKTIQRGQTASVSVSVSGSNPFSYQWYQGSSGDTSNAISGATSSSYTTLAL